MFPQRYFPITYYPDAYWAKVGDVVTVVVGPFSWTYGTVEYVGFDYGVTEYLGFDAGKAEV